MAAYQRCVYVCACIVCVCVRTRKCACHPDAVRCLLVLQFADISRDDVLEMVFTLRVDDALAQMRRAFPTSFPRLADFDLAEPSDFPDRETDGYGAIERDYIDPIERANDLSLRIGGAIAQVFGAHG